MCLIRICSRIKCSSFFLSGSVKRMHSLALLLIASTSGVKAAAKPIQVSLKDGHGSIQIMLGRDRLLEHIFKLLCQQRCLNEHLSPKPHIVINLSTFRVKQVCLFTKKYAKLVFDTCDKMLLQRFLISNFQFAP